MKPAKEWTAHDFFDLVSAAAEEGSDLEFKRCEALLNTEPNKNELVKDVTSFANANGGAIVFGIAEIAGGVAGEVKGLEILQINEDWVNQVISSGIEPRIPDVATARIDLGEGLYGLVISIPPPGPLAPYQSKRQHRYFRRYNRQAQAMLDHEIRQMMSRRSEPDLYLNWNLKHSPHPDRFDLGIGYGNNGDDPVLYSSVRITLDTGFEFTGDPFWILTDQGTILMDDGVRRTFQNYDRNFLVPTHMPIFKGREYNILNTSFSMKPGTSYYFSYIMSAPGCSRMGSGKFSLQAGALPAYEKLL